MSPTATLDEVETTIRVMGEDFRADIILSHHNRRVQVLDYQGPNLEAMTSALIEKARDHSFDKVFLKAPSGDRDALRDAGMLPEATITGYFGGRPSLVMSCFLGEERRQRPFADDQEAILKKITGRPADDSIPQLPEGYVMRRAEAGDADQLAALYQQVFATYPFPITSPDYLIETMESHVVYRIIFDASRTLVAAASAETSAQHQNAEMTDFATLPSQRGLGLAQHLLAALEEDMAERRIPNLYTIARTRSAGMNRVFYNRGYEWTGTLVNNCHISGHFEDMHVWCKSLAG